MREWTFSLVFFLAVFRSTMALDGEAVVRAARDSFNNRRETITYSQQGGIDWFEGSRALWSQQRSAPFLEVRAASRFPSESLLDVGETAQQGDVVEIAWTEKGSNNRVQMVYMGQETFPDYPSTRTSFFVYPLSQGLEYNTFPPRKNRRSVELVEKISPVRIFFNMEFSQDYRRNTEWLAKRRGFKPAQYFTKIEAIRAGSYRILRPVQHLQFDRDRFFAAYQREFRRPSNTQRSALGAILTFFEADPYLNNVQVAAYILATVRIECGGNYEPVMEGFGDLPRQYFINHYDLESTMESTTNPIRLRRDWYNETRAFFDPSWIDAVRENVPQEAEVTIATANLVRNEEGVNRTVRTGRRGDRFEIDTSRENPNYVLVFLDEAREERAWISRTSVRTIDPVPTRQRNRVTQYKFNWQAMSLGNTFPGDGFTYRGRGYAQITGRRNYTILAEIYKQPYAEHPDLLLQAQHAYNGMTYGIHFGIFRKRTDGTPKKISDYFENGALNYGEARDIINGDGSHTRDSETNTVSELMDNYGDRFETALTEALVTASDDPNRN